MPAGGIFATLGIFSLECGSCFYNLWLICTDNKLLRDCKLAGIWMTIPRHRIGVMYVCTFTFSNVISAGCLIESSRWEYAAGNTGQACFALISGFGLQYLRQNQVMSTNFRSGDQAHTLATATPTQLDRQDLTRQHK